MLQILRRLLVARGGGAIFGVLTVSLALWLLPDQEFAIASIAVSYGAVLTALLYQPFAKYALITSDSGTLLSVFWKAQPVLVTASVLPGALVDYLELLDVDHIGAAGGLFAIAQGFKFFCGELARRDDIGKRLERLYFVDGALTLILVAACLSVRAKGAVYLASSALSTLLVCAFLFRPIPISPVEHSRNLKQVLVIYRYAFGPVSSSALNSASISMARTAAFVASPPGMAASIQFILDVLQKPVALISSSATSAAVPYLVGAGEDKRLMKRLSVLMVGVFIAAIVGAVLIAVFAEAIGVKSVDPRLAVICAYFVWANRYKSTVMDVSLTASRGRAAFLVFGALASCLIMPIALDLPAGLGLVLVTAGAVILGGGVLNVACSIRLGRSSLQDSAVVLALPILATCFAFFLGSRVT